MDFWQMHNMEKRRSITRKKFGQGIQAETERWNLGSHEKCNGMRWQLVGVQSLVSQRQEDLRALTGAGVEDMVFGIQEKLYVNTQQVELRIGRWLWYGIWNMGYTLYCAYFASHSVFPRDLSAKRAKADSYDDSKPSAGAGSQAAEVPLETTDDEHNDDYWWQVWDPITRLDTSDTCHSVVLLPIILTCMYHRDDDGW